MSVNIQRIMDCMESLAPEKLKENWDNVGLLVGESNGKDVSRILFALDVNDGVIDEAIKKECQLIITHHPVIFSSIKNVNDRTPLGRRIIRLIKNNISVFSAHTNFDTCSQGTNATLAKLLELENIENLCTPVYDNDGLGKVGTIKEEMKFIDFAQRVKSLLMLQNITITGNREKVVRKVGMCTGSGADGELMTLAKNAGCDVYITGDVKFHNAQFANDIDLCLIDGTHYGTEVIAMKTMADFIAKSVDVECILSDINGQTLEII